MRQLIVIFAVALLPACKKPHLTAMDWCLKFQTFGQTANCKVTQPTDEESDAIEAVTYDDLLRPGTKGGLWRFGTLETWQKYVDKVSVTGREMMKKGAFPAVIYMDDTESFIVMMPSDEIVKGAPGLKPWLDLSHEPGYLNAIPWH
jgi:hypothetical protein